MSSCAVNEGESRSPCIRGSRVRAPDPAKVLSSPDTSVWGLRTSVAKSDTVRHVRGYRGFVRFPLWHSLENLRLLGALVHSRCRCPCLGTSNFRCSMVQSSTSTCCHTLVIAPCTQLASPPPAFPTFVAMLRARTSVACASHSTRRPAAVQRVHGQH
jgi:hypothetical protein